MGIPPRSRLIDWTGERMVPWADDVQVAYEHLHRYWFASGLVAGRSVLDLGCGEGYGSAILAAAAESVVGVDVDARTIEHCVANYRAGNLEFRQGSALDLSPFAAGAFGAVVCFEVIEHLAEQEQLLDQIAHVLAPDGLLICSTPERTVYSGPDRPVNEFHVRELDGAEFETLLARHFEHRRFWGQRTITGSLLYEPDRDGRLDGPAFFAARDGEQWERVGVPPPMYLVAVASRRPLPDLATGSALADATLALVRAANADRARSLEIAALGAVVVGARVVDVARGFGATGQDASVVECSIAAASDVTSVDVRGYAPRPATLELRLAGAEREVALVGGPFVVSVPVDAAEGDEIDVCLAAEEGWRLHELRLMGGDADPREALPSGGRIVELTGGLHADGWVTDDARCVVELADEDAGLRIAGWRPDEAPPATFAVWVDDRAVLTEEIGAGPFAVEVAPASLPGRRVALRLVCDALPDELTSGDESRALSWRLQRLGAARAPSDP